jgi:hypothetical protein
MRIRIYSPFYFLLVMTAFSLFMLPKAAKADGPAKGIGVDFFGNVRAGMCDQNNPLVGIITGSTPDDALVYGAPGAPMDRMCVPVTGTDGHQLTLGEFKSIQGTARVLCVKSGTLVNVHLTGLQPKGIYTAWIPVTAGNIFPPALAATALGSTVESIANGDPVVNYLTASESGEGQLTLYNRQVPVPWSPELFLSVCLTRPPLKYTSRTTLTDKQAAEYRDHLRLGSCRRDSCSQVSK